MAHLRPSSPISPEPLTPRSKIRALLATIESSDDEDVAPRPKGRLASRMRGAVVSIGNSLNAETSAADFEGAPKRADSILDRQDQAARGSGNDNDDDDDSDLPVAPGRLQRRALTGLLREEKSIPSARSPSPDLFVSSPMRPSPSKDDAVGDSGSDDNLPAVASNRFKSLIQRKKEERLAREAAEAALQGTLSSELEGLDSAGDDYGLTDDEGDRRLTQSVRPMRKASKKAIEEMNRETQRLARSMQLALEAKTSKRIPMSRLFERFNYDLTRPSEPTMHSSSRLGSPNSDMGKDKTNTPPSSPPAPEFEEATGQPQSDDELATLDQVMDTLPPPSSKEKRQTATIGHGKASKDIFRPKRRLRVVLPPVLSKRPSKSDSDSEDELQVICTAKDKAGAIFDRIPMQECKESHSLRALRALAQVKSPGKPSKKVDGRSRMTSGELHAQLCLKARQQAKLEREDRLGLLKAQEITIQTTEERERQEQEVEDLVAKARQEAQKIMQQERVTAKKNENGADDPLACDDSDDDEYDDTDHKVVREPTAIEFSGSEDEAVMSEADSEGGSEVEDDGEKQTDQGPAAPFLENDAEETGSENEDQDEVKEDEEQHRGVGKLPASKHRRTRKLMTVLSDNETEAEATPRPAVTSTQAGFADTVSPAMPTSVLRSARKSFIPGLPVQGAAGLGLTQIFAGTMNDQCHLNGPTPSVMPDFDKFPPSNFLATADNCKPMDDVVMDNQRESISQPTQEVQLDLPQSQMRGLGSILLERSSTQMSEVEPSQDAGLQEHTPLKQRFIEPPVSTVETIAVDPPDEDFSFESPLVRKGRLRRRMVQESIQVTRDDVFTVMAEGARKTQTRRLIDVFDRKKTKARDMVEEQAEESEDEYAGLGGTDCEESDIESNSSLQEIIDDTGGSKVDESQLAAFYADRERAKDEKEVEKLFRDITTGMLRLKRAADYDLSDSDDGGEARRRMKRRQFAKMQKALFADERVKKMAESPGNQAFLRTIEDRGSDDEMATLVDLVDAPDEPETQPLPQSQSPRRKRYAGASERRRQTTIPDSQPARSQHARAPVHLRRTAASGRRPCSLGKVRTTLSDLLAERQDYVIPATQAGSDSDADADDDDEDDGDAAAAAFCNGGKENQAPDARRGNAVAVIDRLSLKHRVSAPSSTRLAFASAPASSAAATAFKVPALLRRATTNSTLLTSDPGCGPGLGPAGSGFADDVKMARAVGRATSSLSSSACAAATTARDGGRRRTQKTVRGAEQRRGLVTSLLDKGSFSIS